MTFSDGRLENEKKYAGLNRKNQLRYDVSETRRRRRAERLAAEAADSDDDDGDRGDDTAGS